MKKLDNFAKSLAVLEKSDFARSRQDEIYRTGIAGQFSLTFELAWKALQAVLQAQNYEEAETGSPRDILRLAYEHNFISDYEIWADMLRKRNVTRHVYNEEEIDELISLIESDYLYYLRDLYRSLKKIAP